MKDQARMALAVAAGYYLGRRRKLRWALSVAAAGATKRLTGRHAGLLQQGTKLLANPEVKALADTVRGRLVEAGRAAAVSAASSRIDALTDRLQERTESLRRSAEPAAARETVGRVAGSAGGRRVRRGEEPAEGRHAEPAGEERTVRPREEPGRRVERPREDAPRRRPAAGHEGAPHGVRDAGPAPEAGTEESGRPRRPVRSAASAARPPIRRTRG